MNRYLCIHAHFYQPPRENPWLESIELQDSAYPYHDWNDRIMAECYAPNGAARILDAEQRIVRIVNNYESISFNFGPTLLSWMEDKAPQGWDSIREADRRSMQRFSGHGSAIAQCYNHMIMPLANSRDKRTQVYWGIQDFRRRFGREPEGMWLPETAVDLETLSIMAEMGIAFTILAPSQASAVRQIGATEWEDVSGSRIDPTRAYRIDLPKKRSMALFFYDGPVSRAVAFEHLLDNGEKFAWRLLSGYSDTRTWPQLMHIATDGETYGHHHAFGEMALAWAIQHTEAKGLAKITNYGEFLAANPPTHEVRIMESTAWSCVHGVGRWSFNCGCNSGGRPGWNQEWRKPLRAALDWLRDTVNPLYERKAAGCLRDPWRARDEYITVVLDRSPQSRRAFGSAHFLRELSDKDAMDVWKLLELQRHAMLMYTSCGWFFDELSGIETVQVMQYACRVVQLADQLFDKQLEKAFVQRLAEAKSNLPEHRDGAQIWETMVRPAMVDLPKLAAHFAISSVFEDYAQKTRIYAYSVDVQDHRTMEAGRMKMAAGRARFTSEITLSTAVLTFAVLYFGDHNIVAGVREFGGRRAYDRDLGALLQTFSHADVAEAIRLINEAFGPAIWSLKSMFRDEQRRTLDRILSGTLEEAEAATRQMYDNHAPLLRYLTDMKTPLPRVMKGVATYALNNRLRRAFEGPELDAGRIHSLLDEAGMLKVRLDSTELEFTIRKTLEHYSDDFAAEPTSLSPLMRLTSAVTLARTLPFPVVFWSIQNKCWDAMNAHLSRNRELAAAGDPNAKAWVAEFSTLCDGLSLRLPAEA